MKSMVACVFALGISACLTLDPARAQEKAEEGRQPVLVLEEVVHDLGVVFESETYKHAFVVRNEGKADLVIEKVKPG